MARRKDKPKLIRKHVFLEEQQVADLVHLSDITGAPFAELVRRGVDLHLNYHRANQLTRKETGDTHGKD